MNMKQKILLVAIVGLLAGCSKSSEQRMMECEYQGISRDTCYLAEQNRKNSRDASMAGSAQKQVLENQKEALHSLRHEYGDEEGSKAWEKKHLRDSDSNEYRHNAEQHAQSAHKGQKNCTQVQEGQGLCDADHPMKTAAKTTLKPFKKHLNGIEFRRSPDGFMYIDGSLAAVTEENADVIAYQAGLFTVVTYKKTGKVAVMENGKFLGYAR